MRPGSLMGSLQAGRQASLQILGSQSSNSCLFLREIKFRVAKLWSQISSQPQSLTHFGTVTS